MRRKREGTTENQEEKEGLRQLTAAAAAVATTTSAFGRAAKKSASGAARDEPPAETGRVAGSDPAGAERLLPSLPLLRPNREKKETGGLVTGVERETHQSRIGGRDLEYRTLHFYISGRNTI